MVTEKIIPKGYKQTDVGVIPDDWEIKTVSQFGKVKRGAGSQYIKYVNSNGVRLIRINDFFEDNPVFVSPTEEIMRFAISEQDVLFAGTGASAGASYIPKEDWIGLPHSYNAPRIRVNKNQSKEFLLYSLQSGYVAKQQTAWFVGAAQPFLDTTAISNFEIATPTDQAEQIAIATALSDVDTLISKLEELILKKRNIKQGAMQKLLKPKEDWEIKKLGEIGQLTMGQSPPGNSYTNNPQDTPLINGAVELKIEGIFIHKFTNKPTRFSQEGDLLFCIRATIGNLQVSDKRYCLGRGVAAIKVYENNDKMYLYYQLSNLFIDMQNKSEGGVIKGLRKDDLADFKVDIPKSKSEQTAIAQVLSDMDAEIEELEQKLDKYKMIKQGMMQELLTGRTRLI